MTQRRADLYALLILTLIATALFADVLAGVNGLYMRDLTRYYYPAKQILRDIVLHGEFPYWNRWFSGGQPIAANPEHEVFYPFTWLILLPSYDLGFRLLILVHVYIGLYAMYALLRSMAIRPFAATIGALTWGIGGVYLSYINLLPILFCAAWLPATCLFVRRFLLRPNGRDFALASLFLGLQFLVGEPTTVMQTGLLLGFYALYRGWYSAPRLSKMISRVTWVGMISVCGLLAGAAQILPALDHVQESARSRPFDYNLVRTWSMPWAKFAELVYPNILGHISINRVMWYWGGGLYPGMGSPFLFSVYSGLLFLAIAVGSVFARPRGGRLVLLLFVTSSVFALGGNTPLLWFLYHHGVSAIRYPEKFMMMGVFAGIVFAARMLDRILDGDEAAREGALGFAVAATTIAAVFAVLAFLPAYSRLFMKVWGQTPSPGANRMVELSRIDWIVASIRGALLVALLATIRRCGIGERKADGSAPAAASGEAKEGEADPTTPGPGPEPPAGGIQGAATVALPSHPPGRRQLVWMALALLYVAADLGYTTWELNPRMPRRFFDSPPVAKTLRPNHQDYRVFHEADWWGQEDVAKQFFSTGDAVYWVVRNGLFPMTPAGSGVQTVIERDYDKTSLLPTIDLIDSVWDVKRSGRRDWYEPFLAFSNAWYHAVYSDFKAEKGRNKGNFKASRPVTFLEGAHYPRYYFADQMVTITDRKDFVDKLSNQNFSRAVAFVTGPSFVPARGVVHSYRETNNSAVLDVESFGQGFLVMSVTPQKYWRLTIDGGRATPVVTNIAYQGLVITPGRHRVEMQYRNELVVIGLGITFATAGLLIVIFIVAHRRHADAVPDAYEETVHVAAAETGTDAKPAHPSLLKRPATLILAIVVAVTVGGLVGYSLSLKKDIDSQLYIPRHTKITPEITLLQEYVRIDTSNPPGNETRGARYLAAILARNGVPAEIIESAPGRGNVYARIKGTQPGEGLMLLSHIDVVPAPPAGWTRPPFAGSIWYDTLYGRGTLDMKGIGICELAAFLNVARTRQPPRRDIVFLAVADEEEGGHLGTEWLLAHRPDIFAGVRYAMNEGGITETQQERISYVGIEVGTKLHVSVRLRARDRATMESVRIALEPYVTPHDPDRILPEVRLYLHAIAPLRREEGPRLDDIDATIAKGKFWLMNRPYHELMQNILLLDGIREDDRGATLHVELFNLPDESPDARVDWLRSTISPLGGHVDAVLSKFGPAPFSPLDSPFYRLLGREARRQLGDVRVGPEVLAVSNNDSRYLRAHGIAGYGIWPFPVNFYQTLGIHGIDERIRLDWFQKGIALTRGVVRAWAFELQPGD